MEAFEAARLLARSGMIEEAEGILRNLWSDPALRTHVEFGAFCGIIELTARQSPQMMVDLLQRVTAGDGDFFDFWDRRSMAEQAVLLEWLGQMSFYMSDLAVAFDSLTRAASLGRDTSIMWRLLGQLYVENGELELGTRYIRRSLQIYRQMELEIVSGRADMLGSFSGQHPLNATHALEDFMTLLLKVTKLATSQKSLKSVRELVVEMIHHFPEEGRLPKIRLLVERTIVSTSLAVGPGASVRTAITMELNAAPRS